MTAYGPASAANAYAKPGALVIAGRTNYADPAIKSVSEAGGHVLIYLDPMIDNDYGRYANLLLNDSAYGPAVPLWPGSPRANSWGNLNDIRPGGVLQKKLEAVLELMVSENPHMAGFFADDVGSRSWFPDIDWSSWSSADQQAYRDGAIEIVKTFRRVADRHGLMVMVNGTWTGGSLASAGGGYPDMSKAGNALADGGYVEHHDGEIAFWRDYANSPQWAASSPVTQGKPFHYAVTETSAGLREFVDSNAFAYVSQQTEPQYSDAVAPWGAFHPTGLPTKVGQ